MHIQVLLTHFSHVFYHTLQSHVYHTNLPYGVSFERILEKIDCVMMSPDCIRIHSFCWPGRPIFKLYQISLHQTWSKSTWSLLTLCHGKAFHTTGPLWGESTGHQWSLVSKGQWYSSSNLSWNISFNNLMNKLLSCQWFETPRCSCDSTAMNNVSSVALASLNLNQYCLNVNFINPG